MHSTLHKEAATLVREYKQCPRNMKGVYSEASLRFSHPTTFYIQRQHIKCESEKWCYWKIYPHFEFYSNNFPGKHSTRGLGLQAPMPPTSPLQCYESGPVFNNQDGNHIVLAETDGLSSPAALTFPVRMRSVFLFSWSFILNRVTTPLVFHTINIVPNVGALLQRCVIHNKPETSKALRNSCWTLTRHCRVVSLLRWPQLQWCESTPPILLTVLPPHSTCWWNWEDYQSIHSTAYSSLSWRQQLHVPRLNSGVLFSTPAFPDSLTESLLAKLVHHVRRLLLHGDGPFSLLSVHQSKAGICDVMGLHSAKDNSFFREGLSYFSKKQFDPIVM